MGLLGDQGQVDELDQRRLKDLAGDFLVAVRERTADR
jgi:hypothetical protein